MQCTNTCARMYPDYIRHSWCPKHSFLQVFHFNENFGDILHTSLDGLKATMKPVSGNDRPLCGKG